LFGHRDVTEKQIERLEKVFSTLDLAPRRKPSSDLDALLDELESVAGGKSDLSSDLRVAAIALKIEHFEIAAYTFLKQLALEEGLKRPRSQLDKNAGEEEKAASDLEGLVEELAKAGRSK
jgi:ferritin-like metal-binding protein YciE